MEAKGLHDASVCDCVCGPQAAAAGAVQASGLFKLALWVISFVCYRFILGDKAYCTYYYEHSGWWE